MVHVFRLALVAMLFVVDLGVEQASAGKVLQPRHTAHQGLRKAVVGKRAVSGLSSSALDCPDGQGNMQPNLEQVAKSLADTSEKHGGREESYNAVLPNTNGKTDVNVHAESKVGQHSFHRSWSWSTHSSSHSSSSFSSSTRTTTSSKLSPDVNADDSVGGDDAKDSNDDRKHQDKSEAQPATQMELRSSSDKTPHKHAVEGKETVVHTSQSHHTSDTTKSSSTSTDNGDGKVKNKHTETKTHKSSSSSSYSLFTNVFHYVVSGDAQHAGSSAPFANGRVEWKKSPIDAAALAIEARIGSPIARPANANVCNRRFPYKGQKFTAIDRDQRFDNPWPKESLDEVSRAALDLHNGERARYGLAPLQWNAELANMAACWADLKSYGHSEDHFCASGENIAMGAGDPCYGDPLTGMKNAVNSFLDEDRNWARNPHLSDDDGHWTQIVWKDTRFVGCAVSQRKGLGYGGDAETMYVVCEYYPAGNIMGQFEHQVPRVRPMPKLRSQCSANEVHT